jgi:hypothetical protein
MALDPAVSDQLTTLILTGAKNSADLTQMADRNLSQGLGVVNTTLIQQHGGVADDSAQFAAMSTADRIPVVKAS